jgi:hypothetical protein
MTVPTEWILTVMIALATVISTLAAIIYRALSNEIAILGGLDARVEIEPSDILDPDNDP